MKVLIDENIKKSICILLKKMDIDVISINDIKKGITDDEVFDIALEQQRVLVTNDKGFVYKLKNINHYGVIWLKTDPKYHEEALKKLIPKIINEELSNKIYTVSKDKYTVEGKRKHYLMPFRKSYTFTK